MGSQGMNQYPNSPGSGEGERLGSAAQLRMENLVKNSAPDQEKC